MPEAKGGTLLPGFAEASGAEMGTRGTTPGVTWLELRVLGGSGGQRGGCVRRRGTNRAPEQQAVGVGGERATGGMGGFGRGKWLEVGRSHGPGGPEFHQVSHYLCPVTAMTDDMTQVDEENRHLLSHSPEV